MRKNIALFCSLFFCCVLAAQTIEFNLPELAGRDYTANIFQGMTSDTIQRGVFDANGKLRFTMPEKHKNYAGILRFSFGQGSQNFVMNGESFSVSLNPMFDDVLYTGSTENEYLKKQFQYLQALFGKMDIVFRGTMIYADDPNMSKTFQQEAGRLNEIYVERQTAGKSSKLYSEKYIRFIEFMNGYGSRYFSPDKEAEKMADLDSIFRTELDMDALYTSGLWNHVISATFNLYPPKQFGEVMLAKFKQIRSQEVFNVLTNDIVTICEQFGWNEAENVLFPYLVESGRIEDPHGRLYILYALSKIKPDDKAPALSKQKDLANSLLIFYESGCSNCHQQLDELMSNYETIKKKGIRVISISADTSAEVYEHHSKPFPWNDKLCDFQGFEGENFKAYGVVATPTIYVIDKKGKIINRYATIVDTGLLK